MGRASRAEHNKTVTHTQSPYTTLRAPLETRQQDAVEGFQLMMASLERVLGPSPVTRLMVTSELDWDWIVMPSPSTTIAFDISDLLNDALAANLATNVSILSPVAH